MNMQEILSQPKLSFVDVREPFEYLMNHIDGALNIPMSSIPQKLDELKKLDHPVVFYCMSGNRSGQVVGYLEQQGFNNIYNGGGVGELEWLMNSMKVDKG